ncbi:MAG: ribonuclease J [Anaerolineae bacterium]|nr:ribonuclease J [Anaerolineae bacterium]
MERLQIIPLGGLGEVGKNMTLLEYGRNILVIDVGLMFPEMTMPGVDYIIPDYDYLRSRADRIRGVVITHGHEDHIGALPHFLQEFNVPVYATKLTRGLIEVRLRSSQRKQTTLHTMEPGDSLHVGPFTVEPYHVCHSIPDAVGLGIDTPVGLVVHSGDFKLDHTPVDGWPTDVGKLAEFSQRGVLVLLSDSTNSVSPGTTPSESTLNRALEDVFRQAKGRVIVATFASLIARLQQVMEVAKSFGRKVAIAGSSMVANVKMAQRLGYINVPEGLLLSLHEISQLPPHQVTILGTGSQGEPRSIMGRLATGRHPSLRITPGDTVVLSSHTIPGNEDAVHAVINRLFQKGAQVFYHPLAPVHVSGHASQEEQKTLLNILRPKFFVPIHGELRHLHQHAKLAQQVGIPRENIAVVENGYVLRFTRQKMEIGERIPGGYVFVDGVLVGEAVDREVIEKREALAATGICSLVFRYDQRRGRLVGEPQIVAQGFVSEKVAPEIIGGAEDAVRATLTSLQPGTTLEKAESAVEKAVSDYFFRQARNRPTMLVTGVQVA